MSDFIEDPAPSVTARAALYAAGARDGEARGAVAEFEQLVAHFLSPFDDQGRRDHRVVAEEWRRELEEAAVLATGEAPDSLTRWSPELQRLFGLAVLELA